MSRSRWESASRRALHQFGFLPKHSFLFGILFAIGHRDAGFQIGLFAAGMDRGFDVSRDLAGGRRCVRNP